MPRPYPEPPRHPTIATHAQTAASLLEIATPILPRPRGRAGRSRGLGGVRIRPREPNRRGVLRQPRRRERRALPGFEGDRAQYPVEMGSPQRIAEGPHAVRIEGGTCEARLQPRSHAALFEPAPHLLEGMRPIEHGAPQGFDPTPTREPMRRMGREEAVKPSSNLQAS